MRFFRLALALFFVTVLAGLLRADEPGMESPPDLGPGQGTGEVPVPEAPAAPQKKYVLKPRVPWTEMALAGLGGGILGAWAGFFNSDTTSSGAIDYSSVRRNMLAYGLTGAGAGAALGWFLGKKSVEVELPVDPKGASLMLSWKF
jgi:hypothetical protein